MRKLAKSPPQAEALFVYLAGHVFHEAGQDFLCCFDTQPDVSTSQATLGLYYVYLGRQRFGATDWR